MRGQVVLRWIDGTFADPEMEAGFLRSEAAGTTAYSRTAVGLAAALFASFGVSDWLFAQQQALALTLIRIAVVGILLVFFMLLRPAAFIPNRQPLLLQVAAIVVGAGYVAVVALTSPDLRRIYLDCVILIVMGVFVIMRLSVARAVISEIVIIVLFDLAYVLVLWDSMQEFVVLQVMIFAAFSIGLFCNYVFERQRRMAYFGRMEAEHQAERLQAALQRTAEAQMRAEQAARVKSDFVAHVSHELRTPLNAVIGFGQVIEQQIFGAIGHAKYAEYARDIRESGEHLLALINDVLDLSKIEAGQMTLHHETLQPQELMRASLVLVSGLSQAYGTPVQMQLAPELPAVRADARAVKQMLVNLLSNAIKFTPVGGNVTVSAEQDDGQVVFTVADDGPGMTPEQVKIALTPFGQVSGLVAEADRGTGLGLALANRLSELHGAPLRIDSALGQGTRVSFALPAVLHAAEAG
ncbi:sensor histidine kinase [Ferrovibrio sp.]|uniref:sensor histidine kinase n=1 Tax=Ferrovibrio sp. TaxID=1917215 RepID=UPI003512E92B